MLEYFYSDARVLQRCRSGPLGPELGQFAKLLKETGYSSLAGQDKMRVVLQLNEWLGAKAFSLQQLDDKRIQAFRLYRSKRCSSHHGEQATLTLFVGMLRQAGVIPAAPERTSNSLRRRPGRSDRSSRCRCA